MKYIGKNYNHNGRYIKATGKEEDIRIIDELYEDYLEKWRTGKISWGITFNRWVNKEYGLKPIKP
jgi:hypothetical protein